MIARDVQESYTDLSAIFNPVGDDLFKPLSTGLIQAFPSLLASASYKYGITSAHVISITRKLYLVTTSLTSAFVISSTESLEKQESIIARLHVSQTRSIF